jgi:phosphatidylglycerol:prolipoprotein diacylglycerol transferase
MHPVLFKIGPITIYTYGFFVFLGVLVGYYLSLRRAHQQKINSKNFSDLIFWSIIIAFLGARLFFIFTQWRLFIHDPFTILFSRSGFVFYGGVIFGGAAFYLISRRKKIPFLPAADILTLYLPLAHALGRIGCFFYGCCYGLPTDSVIGLKFMPPAPAAFVRGPVIPTQIISAFFLVVIFCIIRLIAEHKKWPGQVVFWYVLLYSFFRFIIEFFRGDPRGFFYILSTSQWVSLVLLVSLFFFGKITRKIGNN